ncbi:Ubiquinol-cytochrome c reductase iron-sulfur subunit [Candidatus Hodgkinia cicadicola]|nr:Ubiquinol-cytochrome c reductase iron-sulfur subunit [Candidatus Hodgkinia cicadicola]
MLKMLMPILNVDNAKLLYVFTCIIMSIGVGMISWPLACQFLPDAYMSINPKMEIDLRTIPCGHCIIVNWFGTPVFVRNRLLHEVREARRARICDLKDKYARNINVDSEALAFDRNRYLSAQSENWLVVIAPCTHLGCIPNVTKNGWSCACHGSSYDLSGRVITGPAPTNLSVPKCAYMSGSLILGS